MFRRMWNTLISFSIILQRFWGRNPNNRGGNVKGVGWVHGLDEQNIWIGIDHGKLLFWILNSYCFWNHDDVTWDYPKGKNLGRRKGIFRHTVLGIVGKIVGTL
jgi:hypothetical protein